MTKVLEVTLAALLHDIGKAYQRSVKSDKGTLCDEAKGLEVGRGESSYAHAKWTSDFINRNSDMLKSLISTMTIGEFDAIASCHHNPSSDRVFEKIVAEADRASAGMDRKSFTEKKDDSEVEKKNYTYYTRPLDSIFSQILIDEVQVTKLKQYPLTTEPLFPQDIVKLSSDDYKKLCNSFSENFRELDSSNLYRFVDSFVSLFSKTFQSVPSSTIEKIADVPLPDHAITTAAIAAAMARAYEEEGDSFKPESAKFLWLSGDFGGIQKFIFGLQGESTKNLAKLLRGRSFFVNMLNVMTARYITDACGLPSLNALFLSGGKFQILLADTPKTREALKQAKKEISSWIYKNYFGLIKVFIDDGVPFELEDFQLENNRFKTNVSDKSFISLNAIKKRAFVNELKAEESWVNESSFAETKQKGGLCKLCGQEAIGSDNMGKHCKTFVEYGSKLTSARYITLSIPQNEKDRLHFGKYYLSILNEKEDDKIKNAHAIYCVNNHDFENNQFPRLVYAAYTPKSYMEKTSTFDSLAKKAEGLEALAVLKADVDNLGFIFSNGLNQKNSVSRRRTLSRLFDEFFTLYLPSYLKAQYPRVYTLFAGGDDLCLIGPWSDMIPLAKEIREKFIAYVGNNPKITISAGIELFHTHSPVSTAVDNAELKLDKSKDGGRNRISLFNNTMKWGEEYDVQLEFEKNWQTYLAETNAGENKHSMLYRFLNYWKQWNESEVGSINRLRHRFQFIYDINRNARGFISKEPFQSLVITNDPEMEKKPLFKNLAVGLTITMYKKRTKHEKGDING